MAEMKNKPTFKVTLGDMTYDLKKPTLGLQLAYEEALDKAKDGTGSATKAMVDFICGCGMDRETALLLDSDDYHEAIMQILGAKKN